MKDALADRIPGRDRLGAVVAVGLPAAVWIAGASVPGFRSGALFLAPLFLLLLLWRAGVDPTPLLERVSRRIRRPRVQPARSRGRTRRAPVRSGSGGRLIGLSLAGRAPPRALLRAVS